ncbi:inositol monophosphatase family protein [Nocardia rhamnosiphila]|uniref:inositol monophosphatase family protein n=1 Tax=Nocardia rhamnosiphila TaxID=426716 RepID=UPI00138E13DC|nr:inositol monophosphatase family protein [Nocardia rhamnosiphila]
MTRVLVEAAEIAIRPRFRRLTTDQIEEKAPNDLVTVADLEAERLISRGLLRILDIPVVGEEATAADPALLSALGDRQCWLLDPIDGTSNLVSGRQEYAVMVALLRKGARPSLGGSSSPRAGRSTRVSKDPARSGKAPGSNNSLHQLRLSRCGVLPPRSAWTASSAQSCRKLERDS